MSVCVCACVHAVLTGQTAGVALLLGAAAPLRPAPAAPAPASPPAPDLLAEQRRTQHQPHGAETHILTPSATPPVVGGDDQPALSCVQQRGHAEGHALHTGVLRVGAALGTRLLPSALLIQEIIIKICQL